MIAMLACGGAIAMAAWVPQAGTTAVKRVPVTASRSKTLAMSGQKKKAARASSQAEQDPYAGFLLDMITRTRVENQRLRLENPPAPNETPRGWAKKVWFARKQRIWTFELKRTEQDLVKWGSLLNDYRAFSVECAYPRLHPLSPASPTRHATCFECARLRTSLVLTAIVSTPPRRDRLTQLENTDKNHALGLQDQTFLSLVQDPLITSEFDDQLEVVAGGRRIFFREVLDEKREEDGESAVNFELDALCWAHPHKTQCHVLVGETKRTVQKSHVTEVLMKIDRLKGVFLRPDDFESDPPRVMADIKRYVASKEAAQITFKGALSGYYFREEVEDFCYKSGVIPHRPNGVGFSEAGTLSDMAAGYCKAR